MVTFNKPTTLVVWIFFLTKLNGRQRDKFFQSHGTLRVNSTQVNHFNSILSDFSLLNLFITYIYACSSLIFGEVVRSIIFQWFSAHKKSYCHTCD